MAAIPVLLCAVTASGSTITDFRVYGTNSVIIGRDSRVLTLDVGSNTDVQLNGASANVSQVVENVHSGGAIHYLQRSGVDGNLFAGGEVRIGGNGSFVGGSIDAGSLDFTGAGVGGVSVDGNVVYATTFTNQANGTFSGSVTQGAPSPPDLPVFPAATVFSAGGPDVHDPVAPLPPGVYGLVESSLAARPLLFSSGDYYLDSLSLTGAAQMSIDVTNGPVYLYIVGDATLGNGKHVSVIGGDETDVWVEIHGNWTHGGNGSWLGNLFAPTGRIHIGSGSSTFAYNGYLWAEDIDIEHSVTITGVPAPEPGSATLAFLGLVGLIHFNRRRTQR